jgi:o-succinylbenzoate synthase
MGSVGELLDAVAGYLDTGYVRIKLKIQPGWDVEPVRAVRERFGHDVLLQVDANAAYTLADARHLARLDPFDLLLIEQPLDEEDVLGHAALARQLRTPVCLDESSTSGQSAAAAITLGACSIVNVKPGRVGGYLEARRIHDVCAAHGVPVWCGGMLETGLGRAANVALAALPGFHAARRHVRVRPLLPDRHHRAVRAARRRTPGAHRARRRRRAAARPARRGHHEHRAAAAGRRPGHAPERCPPPVRGGARR